MRGKIFASLPFDEVTQQRRIKGAQPGSASSCKESLASGGSLPTRHTAAGRPLGNLLYLLFVGLVASATIGVFFGGGFFLLVQPAREVNASLDTHDRGSEVEPLRSVAFLSRNSDDQPADRSTVAMPPDASVAEQAAAPAFPDGEALANITKGRAPNTVRAHVRHHRSANHSRKLNPVERAAWWENQRILSAAYDRAHRENVLDGISR
jgi:hypothetical protein